MTTNTDKVTYSLTGIVNYAPGDRVYDFVTEEWRTVARVDGPTLYLEDGGVMDEEDVIGVRLPSERI